MKNSMKHSCQVMASSYYLMIVIAMYSIILPGNSFGQCTAPSGSINGKIFIDLNNNGILDPDEAGKAGVLIQAYNASGQIVGTKQSAVDGSYSLTGLNNGDKIRVHFGISDGYTSSKIGTDNASAIQFVQVPACNVKFGVVSPTALCNEKTEILTTCFVQGTTSVRTSEPTIVAVEYGFNSNSPARKFATHGETGSIWGLAWKSSSKEIFSSSFVKQYSGLKDGHDAIFKTSFNGTMYTTQLFAKLANLGQTVGTLATSDLTDCTYGSQVGKIGLGAIVISPDEKYLYVVNLHNNTLVRIQTESPTAANTVSYNIPGAGIHAFALKYYHDKIYIGTTIPGDVATVLIFDPEGGTFTNSGLKIDAGADWSATPAVGSAPAHWLTDIDFTDKGDMLLSLSDRIGHIYCNVITNRLDEQKGDLLIAWKDGDSWELETRPTSDSEFFSDDFWVPNPGYHSEITLGGIFSMPGMSSVVATVFDPEINSYSGGLHRYNTTNGKKEGSKELYTRETVALFGKATGFGEVIGICGLPEIEIGNLVWIDINKNGIQDSDESGMAGVMLNIFDENCTNIGNTTTDSKGRYVFNNANVASGLLADKKYYIGIDSKHFDNETVSYKFNGTNFSLTKFVSDASSINSDVTFASMPCTSSLLEVRVHNIQHTFDIGLIPSGDCSLKITKRVINDKSVRLKDTISFRIEVLNRGGNVISSLEIGDKLPAGYLFIPIANPGWTNNIGNLVTTKNKRLVPGARDTSILKLIFDQNGLTNDYTNEAVILSAKDGDGNRIPDIKSCFNEPEDGKDADFPNVCDLALIHKVSVERIYTPDSEVSYTTTVCNQGTADAERFDIVNYRNEELDFDPADNPGWTISADLKYLTFKENTVLTPNACRDYLLKFTILEDAQPSQIVNYAEISGMSCTGAAVDFDFDSAPDKNKINDVGGQPNTATDNMKDDHGIIDEDDHDPATLNLEVIDLSINKHALVRRVVVGTIINYNLDVKNEGQVPVSRVKLVDYLPFALTVVDSSWTIVGPNAEKIVFIPGNLQPGQTYRATIKCRVNNLAVHPIIIRNAVEIAEMYDQYNRNISGFDVDSTPDNIRDNDLKDNQKDPVEDDISFYDISLICPPEIIACGTRCVAATQVNNGMFETIIKFAGVRDDQWRVEESEGLYDTTSTPGAPVAFPSVYILDTTYHTADYDYYILKALHFDEKGYSVRVINKFGETETFDLNSSYCQFSKVKLNGPASVCLGSSRSVYKATFESSTPVTYTWVVQDATNTPLDDTLRHITTVLDTMWMTTGMRTIKVFSNAECSAPAQLQVSVGNTPTGSMICLGDFNVSLDSDCSIVVTPTMIAAGNLTIHAAYAVMLTDAHGKVIPNATITAEHAGTKVMAKLIESCSGNSCWSTITVEDKTPPTSICRDISLPCFTLNQYQGPFERDNCGDPIQNILVSEKVTAVCQDTVIKYLDRVYQATDKFGNKSAFCSMRIKVLRPDLSETAALLTFPANRMMGTALLCDEFKVDKDGRPDPSVTGVPKYASWDLYPSIYDLCHLTTWYTDREIRIGCILKIIRTWHVYEQCGSLSQYRTKDQTIEITDNKAPYIKPIANDSISTSGHLCEGEYLLRMPDVIDTCSSIVTIEVTYPGGFIANMTKETKIKLPASILPHTIIYKVFDACLNARQTSFTVKVIDKTPPTVICKGEIVVGLNSNGQAYVYSVNINNGSFDGCGMDSMKVAKMVSGGLIPDSLFKEFIGFECQDAGRSTMAALRVWDVNGNSNSCMMNIVIQDKFIPKIICPADVTIDCSDAFTGMDLTQFGNAIAIDACNPMIRELGAVYKLNSCRVGTIERTFEAFDGSNVATCKQIITVGSNIINRFDPERDVRKPLLLYEVNDKCSSEDLKPDNLPEPYRRPIISQTSCSMAAATYKDEVYTFATGACFKILRTWTIIDWCEMERMGSLYQPYHFIQTIKVNNTVPPFFVGEVPVRDTFYTVKGNCNDATVNLSVTGRDLCTQDNQLRWTYKIDYRNDAVDVISNVGNGNRMSINATFPVGLHKVQWSFEDACGNIVTKDQFILVINNDKPVATGLEKVSVSVIPWDTNGDGKPDIERVCLIASTLNTSSFSLCCVEPLKYSFSSDINDVKKCFDCSHVDRDNKIQLWVTDCNGNQDFVTIKVDVQDNNSFTLCETICDSFPVKPIITGTNIICKGVSTNLTASGGTNYVWSSGETTATISVSPSATATYTVTVTGLNNCTASASRTITVNDPPIVTIAGANICTGTSTTLTATGGGTYLWNTGNTTASINVSPLANTTYTVTVTAANGCTASTTRIVVISPPPVINITGTLVVCVNQSTTLTAFGGVTYLWSTQATTSSITVTPVVNTSYTVTVTDANGCTATQSRTVTVSGLTINPAIAGDNIICVGETTSLTASGGVTYIWSNNATTATINVAPIATTTFTVTVTDLTGCTGIARSTVQVNPKPNVDISGSTVFCRVNPVALTASGALTYLWSTGQTTSSISVSPISTTEYRVTGTDSNGCVASDTIRVSVADFSQVSITGNNIICLGDSTILKAIGGISYIWNTSQTADSIKVRPAVTTTYTVTVTIANGCTTILNRTVTVNIPPAAGITGNLSICSGGSTALTASGGGTYLWNTGLTTSVINVTPLINTTYTVTVTGTNSCTSTRSVIVTLLRKPEIIITGDTILCPGDSTLLTASGGASYVWSTGATSNSVTVKPMNTSTFTVTATDANGCTGTKSVNVTVTPTPLAVIVGSDSICVGANTTLTASGGIFYLWNTGATTTSINVSPQAPTTYTVTVTDINGCTATAIKRVSLFSVPIAVITGDRMICLGESTTLTASGGVNYIWNTNATTASINISPIVTTTYTVTVTDVKGCTASTSATVIVDPGTLVCTTKNFIAQIGPNGSVTIRPEDISTGAVGACTNITATVNPGQLFCNDIGIPQIVTLTVTNINTNSSLSCTAQVTVVDTLKPTLTCPPNVSINCETYNPLTPLSTYGTATSIDNCLVGLTIIEAPAIRNLNNCNAGQIIRTFTATDRSGNTTQCVQIITVGSSTPISPATIVFPPNISVSNCTGIDTSKTGRARISTTLSTCSKVSITFSDNAPPQNPLCSQTIVRTWLVVDTCQLVPGTNNGRFTFAQTITVTPQQPLINGPITINLTIDPSNCSAALAGIFHTANGCNLALKNSQNELPSFDLSGNYPAGQTQITLTVTDICGGTATFNVIVDAVDTSTLKIICRKAFPQMTDQLFVDEPIEAYYRTEGSCLGNIPIIASFNRLDPQENTVRYTCSDLLQTYSFPIYFFHPGETNHFFTCTAISRTQDPGNFCGSARPTVSGNIHTETAQPVKNVSVDLKGSEGDPVMSGSQGNYKFPEMPVGGAYNVIPTKDTDLLEGISTLDLIQIQRHILKTQILTSPYQIIAADINKDKKITASDITLLRKAILGIQDNFNENKSWRMIDKLFEFPDHLDPFMAPFPESYNIESLDNSMVINWVGVKIGDVNSSYVANANDKHVDNRSADYSLILHPPKHLSGESIIPVTSSEGQHITGLQFSMSISEAESIVLTSEKLNIENYHYSFKDGILKLSWHNSVGINAKKDELLFNVHVIGSDNKTAGLVPLALTKLIKPEVYTLDGGTKKLGLVHVSNLDRPFELLGNTPNPWNQQTGIHFYLPENGDVVIKVRDITGRVVYNLRESMPKGEHTISLTQEQLNASGLLFYDITFGKEIRTMKMLNIR